MAGTLERIADLSGVSKSTVSRVVNGDTRVSPETRQKVLTVITAEGYRPNFAARGLASGRTNILAAVMPVAMTNMASDPYFRQLLQGLARSADAHDQFLMLSLAEATFKHTPDEVIRQGVVDGVLFSIATFNDPMLEPLIEAGMPLVCIGPVRDNRVSFVDADNRGSAKQATTHLLRLGRRRIATIAGPAYSPVSADRLGGYRDAIESWGLPYDEGLVFEGDFTEMSGRAGVRALTEGRPDAIFAANDAMASGALTELTTRGVRVPDDVAIVGFDDLQFAAEMEPPLTTIRQRPEALAETAVELLLDVIAEPDALPRRVVLPTELIVRASCGARSDAKEREKVREET